MEGEYFQLPYTPKQDYFDVFAGPWWLTPFEAVANVGVFAGNSFIDITNTLTGGVNLLLYAGQNPNWNYELMDAIAYGPGKLSDETIYYFQNTSSEQIIGDLKDSFTDPATYERALANFVILWVGYKSSVIKNQGNGLEGRNFDFDEVDDFVKESYDDLSAEGKQVVGEYVDDAAGYSGKLIKVNKPDTAADALAKKLGGQSRVKFANDPLSREFDVVSDKFIAQTKEITTLGKSFRNQAKATFEAAKATGRSVYYEFTTNPNQAIINKLNDYSSRYGVELIIDILN